MCTLIIARNVFPSHPLVVAANRDEFFDRPASVPTYWPGPPGIWAPRDERAMIGRVEVVIERWYATGQRPSSRAVLQSSAAIDTVAARRGLPSSYPVPIARDESLAARLAARITRRLAEGDR